MTALTHARQHLAPYQRVRRIEFFELPKTISGKIRRVELRARENELAGADRSSRTEWRDEGFPDLAMPAAVSGTRSSAAAETPASEMPGSRRNQAR